METWGIERKTHIRTTAKMYRKDKQLYHLRRESGGKGDTQKGVLWYTWGGETPRMLSLQLSSPPEIAEYGDDDIYGIERGLERDVLIEI